MDQEAQREYDPVEDAKDRLIKAMSNPQLKEADRIRAAAGIINYFLAAEIGGLITLLHQSLFVPIPNANPPIEEDQMAPEELGKRR